MAPLRRRLAARPAAVLLVAACSIGASYHASPLGRGAPTQRREASLPRPREETAAAALGGHLYVMGGFDAAGRDTSTVFVSAGERWAVGPALPLALDHPSAAVADGRLYLAGGFTDGRASDRTFVLARNGRSWAGAGRLRHARGALALVSLGGTMYALGGKDGSGTEVGPDEVYHPASRSWSDLPPLPVPRDHVAGFAYRGWACVAGGRAPNTARVDCYDPLGRAWRRLPDLPLPTSGAGAAVEGDQVVVGGGELAAEGGGIIAQLARLRNGRWTLGAMLVPRHGLEFAPFQGRIWACGGGIAPGLHPVATCTSVR